MKKVLVWGGVVIVFFFVVMVSEWPDGKLRMIGCRVGQGDATLITHGFTQVLVDAGPSEQRVLECLGRHVPFWDRTIELAVISHPQADHIGGLTNVVERFTVDTLIGPDIAMPTEVFTALTTALVKRNVSVVLVKEGMKIRVGEMTFTVLHPNRLQLEEGGFWEKVTEEPALDVNDYSVVLLLEHDGFEAFLGGDISTEVEAELVAEGRLRDVEVYKASHHGSQTSNSEEILKRLDPEVIMVEVGEGNRYGHPNAEVLLRFDKIGARVIRTDKGTDVGVVWDGGSLALF